MFTTYKKCTGCNKTLEDIEIKRDNTCVYCGGKVKRYNVDGGNPSDYHRVLTLQELKDQLNNDENYSLCYKGETIRGEYDHDAICIYPSGDSVLLDQITGWGDYGYVTITSTYEITEIAENGLMSLNETSYSPHVHYPSDYKGKRYKRDKTPNNSIIKKTLTFSDINVEYAHVKEEFENDNNVSIRGNFLHIGNYRKRKKSSGSGGKGCYIATCVYGSYDCPEVWVLRRFRDNTLSSTRAGRFFIKIYYAVSPKLVMKYGDTKLFINLWRKFLDKLVNHLRKKGTEDTEYFDR